MPGSTDTRYRAAYEERFPRSALQELHAPPWQPPPPPGPSDPPGEVMRRRELLDATDNWSVDLNDATAHAA
jgi:hypothetical protein